MPTGVDADASAQGGVSTQADTLAWDLTTTPSGMQVNTGTGELYWRPGRGQKGDNAVVLRVTDEDGNTGTENITINVTEGVNQLTHTQQARVEWIEVAHQPAAVQTDETGDGAPQAKKLFAAPAGTTVLAAFAITEVKGYSPTEGRTNDFSLGVEDTANDIDKLMNEFQADASAEGTFEAINDEGGGIGVFPFLMLVGRAATGVDAAGTVFHHEVSSEYHSGDSLSTDPIIPRIRYRVLVVWPPEELFFPVTERIN